MKIIIASLLVIVTFGCARHFIPSEIVRFPLDEQTLQQRADSFASHYPGMTARIEPGVVIFSITKMEYIPDSSIYRMGLLDGYALACFTKLFYDQKECINEYKKKLIIRFDINFHCLVTKRFNYVLSNDFVFNFWEDFHFNDKKRNEISNKEQLE